MVAGRAGGRAVAGGVRAGRDPGPGRGCRPVQDIGQSRGLLVGEVAGRQAGLRRENGMSGFAPSAVAGGVGDEMRQAWLPAIM